MSTNNWSEWWGPSTGTPNNDVTRGWSQSLYDKGLGSDSLRWSALSAQSGFYGLRYNGVETINHPMVSMALNLPAGSNGFLGNESVGFMVHMALPYLGATTGVNGIFLGCSQRTDTFGQIEIWEVINDAKNLVESQSIPDVGGVPGWIQWQAMVAINDTRPSPALPEVRTFYRWNAGTLISAPGSGSWTGWSVYDHDVASEPTFFNTIASGAHRVSLCRLIESSWSGSYLSRGRAYIDEVSIKNGTV